MDNSPSDRPKGMNAMPHASAASIDAISSVMYSPTTSPPRYPTGPGDTPPSIQISSSSQKSLPKPPGADNPKGKRAGALKGMMGNMGAKQSRGGGRADALVSGAAAVGVGRSDKFTAPGGEFGSTSPGSPEKPSGAAGSGSGVGPPPAPAVALFAPGLGGRRGSADTHDSDFSWMTKAAPSGVTRAASSLPPVKNPTDRRNVPGNVSAGPSVGLAADRGARVDFTKSPKNGPKGKPRDVTWDSVVGTVLGGPKALDDKNSKDGKDSKGSKDSKDAKGGKVDPSDIKAKMRTPSPGTESDDDLKEQKEKKRGCLATWWVWCCFFWFCAAGILLALLLWQLLNSSSAVVDLVIEPVDGADSLSRLAVSEWSSTRLSGARSLSSAPRLGSSVSELEVTKYEIKIIGAYISEDETLDTDTDVLVYTHPECGGDITTCDISSGTLSSGDDVENVVTSYVDLLEDYSTLNLRLGASAVNVKHSATEYAFVHLVLCQDNNGGASSLRISTNETSNVRYVVDECQPLTVGLDPAVVFDEDVPAGHVIVRFDDSYEAGYVSDTSSVDNDAYCQTWSTSNLCVVGPGWYASGQIIVGGWTDGDDGSDGGGWIYGGDGDDDVCTPNCEAGWECGDDGCGGSCGTCDDICDDHVCCDSTCDFVTCGASSGCGVDCGCAGDDVCDGGTCCTPDCDGLVCGDDGCGGTCGECDSGAGEYCLASQEECCVPDCSGKVCGSDGCDGSCGECDAGTVCYTSGLSCSTAYNTVVIGEWRFALLSNFTPEGYGAPCDTGELLTVPNEWELAPSDEESLLAISLRPWGTWGVVTADGNMYEANQGYTRLLATGRIHGDAVGGYGVTGCSSEILIRQDKNIVQDGQLTLTQPSVNITQWVTFGGYDYAAIDNANPYEVENQACQSYFYEMPDGWSLAPHEDDSVLVIGATGYDTWCMVLADGQSYDRNMEDCGDEQLKSAQGSGNLYYGVNSCNRRVLIRRVTVNGTDLWNPRPVSGVPDKMWFAPNSGYIFSTMMNTDFWSEDIVCQEDPVLLEPGWEVVNETSNFDGLEEAASAGRWGVYCVVMANGTSVRTTYDRIMEDCGDEQLEGITFLTGSTYYKTNSCDRTVLLQSTDGKHELQDSRDVQLKTLVVVPSSATDEEYAALETLMQGWGTSYEMWDRSYAPTWVLPSGAVAYSSVIFHSWPMLDEDGDAFWEDEEVVSFRAAQAKYGMRAVYWSYSSYNLPWQDGGDETTFTDGEASLSWVPSEAVDEFAALSGADLTTVFDVEAAGSFYYEDFQGLEVHGNITVLLCESATPVATDCASSVAVMAKHESGIEEIMFGFPFPGLGGKGSGLLNQVTFTWVTRNMYPGMRRFRVTPVVGNMFLESTDPTDSSSMNITESDLVGLSTLLEAPTAPSFLKPIIEYSGAGLVGTNVSAPHASAATDPLMEWLRNNRTSMWFVSGGFTGESLACENGEVSWEDCSGAGPLSYASVAEEIANNQWFAAEYLFADGAWESHCNMSLAPMGGSGAFNADGLRAMIDNGITLLMADNGDELVVDDTPHETHLTTAAINGYAGVRLLPAFLSADGLHDGCASLACNYAMHESEHGSGADTDAEGGLTARAQRFANYIMSGFWDPIRVDQANMAYLELDSEDSSLAVYWFKALVAELEARFPTLWYGSYDLEALSADYVARESRMDCVESVVAHWVNGTMSEVTVHTDGSDCTVAVTLPQALVNVTSTAAEVTVEDYGGVDWTSWVSMNSTTLSMSLDLVEA